MTRVFKHPKYPGLSPMSQRGHDLLDLYVRWELEGMHERWDADVLAAKTFEYFSLCCKQDFSILRLYDDCEDLTTDILTDVQVPRNTLVNVLANLWAQKDEDLLIDDAYCTLSVKQQDVVNECLLLKMDTETKIANILFADWIDMTGSVEDVVDIPAGWLDLYLKEAVIGEPRPPEEFKRYLKKGEFAQWRLKSAILLAEVYGVVADVVADKLEGTRAIDEREARMEEGNRENQHDC